MSIIDQIPRDYAPQFQQKADAPVASAPVVTIGSDNVLQFRPRVLCDTRIRGRVQGRVIRDGNFPPSAA